MTEVVAIETPAADVAPPTPDAPSSPPAAPKNHAERMAAILAADRGEAAGEGEAAPDDAAKPPPAKDPKTDASAAKFAALARENEKAVRLKQEVDTKANLVAEREAKLTAHEVTLKERESKVAAAEARGQDLLEGNPAAIFDRLVHLGVDTPEKLQQLAQGKWKRPIAEVKPDDPNRPLTIKEFEDRQRQAEGSKAEREASAKLVSLTNDETKFEATNLLFTDAERVGHGQRIAAGLIKAGKAFTLDDIAGAIEALAQRDPRWQKITKRSAKSAEAGSSTAGRPATTDPASIARAAPGPKTPSNDSATETTPKLPPPTGSRKQQRAERLRRMYHPEG